MSQINFCFKNSGDEINNDVVFPGAPFLLQDYAYTFYIGPKTNSWRFGIRLSKKETVDFFHPEHRYKSPEFYDNNIDIQLAVGEWDNTNWSLSNRIQLGQYNITGEDHILDRSDLYIEQGIVELKMQYDHETKMLHIFYSGSGLMIESDLDPGNSGDVLTTELKTIFERIAGNK